MAAKVIEATEMRIGTIILLDGIAHQVRKADISKTGKHGHAKVRYEASNIYTGKKKVGVVPGHDRFEVPMINKCKAQVLSIADGVASVMDSESFENYDIAIPEDLQNVAEGSEVEYWDVEDGEKIMKRVF